MATVCPVSPVPPKNKLLGSNGTVCNWEVGRQHQMWHGPTVSTKMGHGGITEQSRQAWAEGNSWVGFGRTRQAGNRSVSFPVPQSTVPVVRLGQWGWVGVGGSVVRLEPNQTSKRSPTSLSKACTRPKKHQTSPKIKLGNRGRELPGKVWEAGRKGVGHVWVTKNQWGGVTVKLSVWGNAHTTPWEAGSSQVVGSQNCTGNAQELGNWE